MTVIGPFVGPSLNRSTSTVALPPTGMTIPLVVTLPVNDVENVTVCGSTGAAPKYEAPAITGTHGS